MHSIGIRGRTSWLFLLSLTALAQQAAPPDNQPALLEGTVVNSLTREPVREARVVLELSGTPHESALASTTDESGHFRFADVAPGRYDLTAEKSGFLDGAWRRAKPSDQGSVLQVESGSRMQDLSIPLFPGGTISGRVLDADGDPVPGSEVTLWARSPTKDLVSAGPVDPGATTNSAGEYRFEGLDPGTYYVSAELQTSGFAPASGFIPVDSDGKITKLRDVPTFYPSALSRSDARGVIVEIGQDQLGIDIRIQRGPTLNVRGKIAGLAGDPSKYSVSADIGEGSVQRSAGVSILPNGDFVINDLPPGKHRLTLMETGGPEIGTTEITLADQDLTGVTITPFKPAQVRVRVVVESELDKPLTKGAVVLIPEEPPGDRRAELRSQDGVYAFKGVDPGQYRISSNAVSGSYLKAVQSAGRALDPESIEVADGATLDLLMILSRNVASLDGDVEASQDQPAESAHVLLISQKPSGLSANYRSPKLDQSLRFSVPDLAPGKYLAFAPADDDSALWSNEEFVKAMESEDAPLDLKEKDHATVHLKLISKDKTDDIRRRLGL